MLELTNSETGAVLRGVAAEFRHFVNMYDERKYPPAELDRLRIAFSRPETVTAAEIEAALIWKYGHTGKTNYPKRQRELGIRISGFWGAHAIRPGEDPAAVLGRWQQLVGPTSFVTLCFLLHLANSGTLPILDQHNFRSVNFHLLQATGRPAQRSRLGRLEDLILVRNFIELVSGNWNARTGSSTPSSAESDRYLMMHGKWLKIQNGNGRPNNAMEPAARN